MFAALAFVCLSLSSLLWASPKTLLQSIDSSDEISKITSILREKMHFKSSHILSENSFNDLEHKYIKLKLLKKTNEELLWTFTIQNIPVCGYYLKDVLMKDGRSLYTVGQIPHVDELESSQLKDDVNLQDVYEHQEALQILKKTQCYFIKEKRAHLVWDLTLREKNQYFKVWLDNEEIYFNAPLSLDTLTVMGRMQTFSGVPEHSSLVVSEYDVYHDGTLTNDFFVTDTLRDPTIGFPRAIASDYNFVYPTDDDRFPEVSAFANAMNVLSYFKGLGFEEDTSYRFVLSLHNVFDGSPNNSSYYPATVSPYNVPSILYGDGDGIAFGNFAVEPDITSHEFSHHVVYGYLYPDTVQGSILHEGLADFFSEVKSNNSCFATSLCISNSLCMGKCLRNAINDVLYTNPIYASSEVHFQSLAISGMLWTAKETIGSGMDRIVYGALKYLVYSSGFSNFFKALFLSDLDLNKGSNACALYDAMIAKGFQSFVTNIDCKNISNIRSASTSTMTSTSTNTNTNTPSPPSKSSSKKCGMIIINGSSKLPPFTGLFLFILPIAFILLRELQKKLQAYLFESEEF